MTAASEKVVPIEGGAIPSRAYRSYLLGSLLFVCTFSFIDRSLLGVLNEPIKQAFNVSDAMMGLLGGPAFAVLYTFMGLPIARLAERFNRVFIVAGALAIWSLTAALCGLAGRLDPNLHITLVMAFLAPVVIIFIWHKMWVSTSLIMAAMAGSALLPTYFASIGFGAFGLLLMTRVAVGIGEAGCAPPSHSLISDSFPAELRASALSIYALGVPIGSMLAAIGGGWLAENFDWRAAFLWLGVPGIVLALVVAFTVREPARGKNDSALPPDFRSTVRTLTGKATFWNVTLGGTIASFAAYGVGQFLNSFFMRTHGLSPFEASIYFGLVLGVASALGIFLGGNLSDRMSSRWPTSYAWVPGMGLMLAAPLNVLGLVAPNLPLLIIALIAAAICQNLFLGPLLGVTQGLVESRMRATAAALLLFVVNLIGFGLGPPVIGMLSDYLAAANYGADYAHTCTDMVASEGQCIAARADGLRLAMIMGVCCYAWAGVHFFLAGRTMQRDLIS